MTEEIQKTAKIITDYIDKIIASNNDKSFINRAELEFGDPEGHCGTSTFKQVLDAHFKSRNITYVCKKMNKSTYHFDITLHDWIKDKDKTLM